MNILILGNGFDLAHGLPTTYMNFLNAVQAIEKISTEKDKDERKKKLKEYTEYKYKDKSKIRIRIDTKIYEILECISDDLRTRDDKIFTIIKLVKYNFWFDYLENQVEKSNDTWIDFEKEIKEVCKYIEQEKEKKDILQDDLFKEFLQKYNTNNEKKIIKTSQLIEKLELDLDKLIITLESYLVFYVNTQGCNKISEDIYNLSIDKVISFNYTNTYQRIYDIYGRKVQYDYIHGRASGDYYKGKSHVVLGFDEYLEGKSRDEEMDFISFKKYYQRVLKGTDNKYIEWIKEIEKNKDESNNLYIFGHSLDITDKDVLRKLILHKNMNTTIYYQDDDTKKTRIRNLISVLGYDEFLTYTGENRIIFVKQKDMATFWFSKHGDIIKKIYNMQIIDKKENDKISQWFNQEIKEIKNGEYYGIEKILIVLDALYMNTQIDMDDMYALISDKSLYLDTKSLETDAKEYFLKFRRKYVNDIKRINSNFSLKLIDITNKKLNDNIYRFTGKMFDFLESISVYKRERNHIKTDKKENKFVFSMDIEILNIIMEKFFNYLDANIDKADELYCNMAEFCKNIDEDRLKEYFEKECENRGANYLQRSRVKYLQYLIQEKNNM
ncbi:MULTISPECIES: AbiH family protein [unclassified Clostridium]|uniref:AbiH family protein n=1 Tax=unclassified Clostridium TaxID=2614128 RepID=UPI0013EEE43B|nr:MULTISPECIES: AbiH family protein [unclassified Clostridium]MBZ9691184.1 bacteriophage abortive infection AbiH family protein [Clostridium sp. M14]